MVLVTVNPAILAVVAPSDARLATPETPKVTILAVLVTVVLVTVNPAILAVVAPREAKLDTPETPNVVILAVLETLKFTVVTFEEMILARRFACVSAA